MQEFQFVWTTYTYPIHFLDEIRSRFLFRTGIWRRLGGSADTMWWDSFWGFLGTRYSFACAKGGLVWEKFFTLAQISQGAKSWPYQPKEKILVVIILHPFLEIWAQVKNFQRLSHLHDGVKIEEMSCENTNAWKWKYSFRNFFSSMRT